MKILNYTIFLSNPILLPIFLNSIYIITIDTTPAIKSAIGPEYIIPSALDKDVATAVAKAVAEAARETGVARI